LRHRGENLIDAGGVMNRAYDQLGTARKIARTLKRSEGATRQKAFSIGLSLDSRA